MENWRLLARQSIIFFFDNESKEEQAKGRVIFFLKGKTLENSTIIWFFYEKLYFGTYFRKDLLRNYNIPFVTCHSFEANILICIEFFHKYLNSFYLFWEKIGKSSNEEEIMFLYIFHWNLKRTFILEGNA